MSLEKIEEGYIPFHEYKTYYRKVISSNVNKKAPLLVLHGGPGSTHNTMEVLDDLAIDRDVIYYDQIGCGLSSIPDDKPYLYTKETWCEELNNVRKYLGLQEVHLLGHSWGGMLAITYLSDYSPKGIKSVILSSTLPSSKLWKQEADRLVNELPLSAKEAILNESSPIEKRQEAIDLYMHLHVGGPWKEDAPSCLLREKVFGKIAYNTAWGESEFEPTGNLKDWDYIDKLKDWNYKVLITNGINDESTPLINKTMNRCIKDSKWVLFKHSRHMSYVEEHDLYIRVVKDFLKGND